MARRDKQKVWVLGHIPPGIDPYSTVAKLVDVCGGKPAVTFLSSDALAQTIAEFGDVVQLAVFAHTHMDELRLLRPGKSSDTQQAATLKPVPLKMVPSISPVDGNNPAFTVAMVDPSTAVMTDYHVFASSDFAGTSWFDEYDFNQAYNKASFAAAPVEKLVEEFHADPKAESSASQAYLHNFFGKADHMDLKLFWPQYVCAMANMTPESYKACVCAAQTSAH
jgi:sphingomyelin phosphodiesterase acid-like 3